MLIVVRSALLILGLAAATAAQKHALDLAAAGYAPSPGLRSFIRQQLAELGKSDPDARRSARQRLAEVAWRASVPSLRKQLRAGKNRTVAVGVLLTLERIGGEDARREARRVLLDEAFNRRERLAALLVLAKLGGPRVAADLQAASRLTGGEEDFRVALALAIARNPDPGLGHALRRLAPRGFRAGRVWAARTLALAEMKAAQARGPVVRLGRSGHAAARRAACLAAAKLDDRPSLAMLTDSLRLEKNDPWTAACACVALGVRRAESARPSLERALGSREDLVREHAALALGWFEGADVTRRLRRAFKDPEPEVRTAVIRGLDRRRDSSLFRKALTDPEASVREAGVQLAVHNPKQSLSALDALLVSERNRAVIEAALAVRQVMTGEALPADHPARRSSGLIMRVLRSSPWRDVDRYRDEPGAPAWRRVRAMHLAGRVFASPERVRARLLNKVMLQLLDVDGKLDTPERRVIQPRGTNWPTLAPLRARSYSELGRDREDLKLWLVDRPFFP